MSLRQGKVPIPFSFSRSKQTMSFLKREKRICFYVYLETIFWWHALLWEHMQDPLLKPLICKTFTTKEKTIHTCLSKKKERKYIIYVYAYTHFYWHPFSLRAHVIPLLETPFYSKPSIPMFCGIVIFCGILSVPRTIVLYMNNVMPWRERRIYIQTSHTILIMSYHYQKYNHLSLFWFVYK